MIKFENELTNEIIDKLGANYNILPSYTTTPKNWPIITTDRINIKFKNSTSLISQEKLLATYNLKIIQTDKFNKNTYTIQTQKDPFTISNELFETGLFEFSYPDFYILLTKKYIPNDTYYNKQWHHESNTIGISSSEAWDINKGSNNVKIAILDDGVDLTHEDLSILSSKDFTNTGFDDSGDHGTSCAGVAAANGDNNIGVTGSCMNCSIVIAKIMPSSGYTLESMIIEAFNWGLEQNVDIFNNSWGFDSSFNIYTNYPRIVETIDNIAKNGRNGKGGIIIFASGNENMEFYSNSLEGLPSIITIGATDYHGSRAYYSNYSTELDFVAPSSTGFLGSDRDGIWTTDIMGSKGYNDNGSAYQETDSGREYLGSDIDTEGKYTKYFGGTSSSAPLVSGVIGLMISENPNLTRNEIVNILKLTADKIGTGYDENGHSKYLGYGKVNSKKALEYVKNQLDYCKDITCPKNATCIVGVDAPIYPQCVCNDGYTLNEETQECNFPQINPCEEMLCSNHGDCVIEYENVPICNCDKGYISDGANNCILAPKEPSTDSCSYQKTNNNSLFLFIFFILFMSFYKKVIR